MEKNDLTCDLSDLRECDKIPNKRSTDKIRIPEYIYARTGYIESHVMVPEGSILECKVVSKFYTGQFKYNLVGLTMTL